MHIGIIGLPNSSKTTIFNALTGGQAETTSFSAARFTVQHASVEVPDPRLDRLVEIFAPRTITRARVEYHDIGGLSKGMSDGGLSGEFLNAVTQNDALLLVIRAFDDDEVPHPELDIDPARDLRLLETELLLSDMGIVERRIDRLGDQMKRSVPADVKAAQQAEMAILERMQAELEEERPLRGMDLNAEEEKIVRNFQLLTAKPMLVLLNTGDSLVEDPASLLQGAARDAEVLGIQGQLEMELAQMDETDRLEFLSEYGIEEPGLNRVIRASYRLLGLQSFFTAGEKEVRAWTVPIGATALDAAGTIHSDLARGFIRSEVTAFDDLSALGGFVAAKQAGKLRLEGRDYVMRDGDVIEVRFNV
jgi:GTP-binding protein YchF